MTTMLAHYAFGLLVWPGLLGASALGFLYQWIARKLMARLQGRQGPPFFQPFFDFVKLLGKDTVVPIGANRALFYALPFMSVCAAVLALIIVPVPGNTLRSFPGDIVLLLFLLEVPVLCDVLAGYVTRSIYGQVSAMREAVMSIAYNVPFLAAVIAMAQHVHSFRLADLQAAPFGAVNVLAAIAFLLAIPARLRSNPAIEDVRATKMPLNVSPKSVLSGNTLDSRSESGTAEFELVIVMKPRV